MPTQVAYGGRNYNIPAPGDTYAWENDLSAYLVALASGGVQTSGGTLTLTADQSFGPNYGLVVKYLKSISANIAQSGLIRAANIDQIAFRNAANTGDDVLHPGVSANAESTDDLIWLNSTTAVKTQLTGNPYAEYTTAAGQSINSGASTIVNYGTKVADTDNAVTTGAAWVFTVPANKGGIYFVQANAQWGNLTAVASEFAGILQKNSVTIHQQDWFWSATAEGASMPAQFSTLVNCNAGDTLSYLVYQSQGAARTLTVTPAQNRIVIKRIS